MPTVSPDGKTYTFVVAAGHRFNDGTAVDAASFKRAIERATAPALLGGSSGGYAGGFVGDIVGAWAHFSSGGGISGIGAAGNVLSITLAAPAGDFPARIAMPFFCATRSTAPAVFSVAPLPSAGPYFVETATASEIVLKRNPFYGGSRARNTDRIRWVPETSSLVADYFPAALASLVARPTDTDVTNPLLIVSYLALNTSKAPFNALNVRRAVALAVDRAAISALRPIPLLPADQFLAPGAPGYQAANLFGLTANTAAATAALAGATPAVTLCHSTSGSVNTVAATAVKAQLQAAGFSVTLSPMPFSVLYDPSPTGPGAANPANCNLVYTAWNPDYADPLDVLGNLFRGRSARNYSFFNGQDAAFAAAAANSDYTSHLAALGALDVTLAGTDIAAVALGHYQTRDVFSARIGCLAYNPAWSSYSLNHLCVLGDSTPPKLIIPSDMTMAATGPAGAAVVYTATATDDTDPNPAVVCTPPSGSVFAIGTTTVNCSATDSSSNTATASFTVHVKGAAEQLADLGDAVKELGPGTSPAVKASLALKLRIAELFVAHGKNQAACLTLTAFNLEVRALSGRKIPPAQATKLIADASRIKTVLGC